MKGWVKKFENATNTLWIKGLTFYLDVLESVFISTFKPEICKQLEFCYKILLF